jgi:phage FluMu gp28-like protein
MYHPFKTIVIISIKDRVAKRVLRKIKFMYKNLPPYLRTKVVNGKGDDIGTASELEFANGSIISSIPTTEEAGRSEAVSLLVIDEAAIVRWAERIWASAFPTLSTGGRAIINSTAYGVGNFFHKLFTDAVAKGNVFQAIRLILANAPRKG